MPKSQKNNLWLAWLRRKFGRTEILSLVAALGLTALIAAVYDPYYDYASLGYMGVLIASLIGNATVILPAPVLLIVFAAGGALGSPLLVGLLAGAGATIGETTGYLAGYSGNRVLEHSKTKQRVIHAMQKHGFWYVLALAFVPNPLFDAAGIAAGALHYPWQKFFLAAFLGKTLKMLIVALAGAYSITWVQTLV